MYKFGIFLCGDKEIMMYTYFNIKWIEVELMRIGKTVSLTRQSLNWYSKNK